MAHSIEDHLNALKAAADRASGTMRQQASAETNREAYRALMVGCFASFEALAYELGGDGAYISDEYIDVTGKNGNPAPVVYSARRPSASTLTHGVQGLRVQGATL